MERKRFLQSAAAFTAGSLGILNKVSARSNMQKSFSTPFQQPAFLRAGARIGVTAPAGYITREEILPAARLMSEWGFKVIVGDTIGTRDYTFAGTDAERAADMQRMLDDPTLDAIMCARGGYGAVRIIDRLNWTRFLEKPKWIIGFSDVTVFHAHLSRHVHVASIHSKMTNSFPDVWEQALPIQVETINSIRKALQGERMEYTIPGDEHNISGTTNAVLVGGNLKTLESLSGTASAIETTDRILFVEDTGEYLYSLDRAFWNLKRSGKLEKLKGLIIGGFKVKRDVGDDEFGLDLYEIVLEKVREYGYPVCFQFPVGHQLDNYALKCGAMHRLEVDRSGSRLTEIS